MSERELKIMLYRAVRELSYIESCAPGLVETMHFPLIVSAEGSGIVNEGMKLLGVKDLALETDEYAGTV